MNALPLQQIGRGLRGRLVHAQRARALRRRGEVVHLVGHTRAGKAVYRWTKRPAILDLKAASGSLAEFVSVFWPPQPWQARLLDATPTLMAADRALWEAAARVTRDSELFDRTLTARRDENNEARFCDLRSVNRAELFHREKLRAEADRLGVTVGILRRECVRFEHSGEWRQWLRENA